MSIINVDTMLAGGHAKTVFAGLATANHGFSVVPAANQFVVINEFYLVSAASDNTNYRMRFAGGAPVVTNIAKQGNLTNPVANNNSSVSVPALVGGLGETFELYTATAAADAIDVVIGYSIMEQV